MTIMNTKALKTFSVNFNDYFKFSKTEIQAFITSILVLGFIISFDKWGEGDVFSATTGLVNLFASFIIIALVLGLHLIAIKYRALKWGYRAEFQIWWFGLIIGIGVVFFSAALTSNFVNPLIFWILVPGGIFFHHIPARSLGTFRYGLNKWEMGLSCMFGTLSTLLLAVILKFLFIAFPNSTFFHTAMVVSLWFAFFSILPIPPLNGSRLFFASRITYGFIFGFVLGFSIFLRLNINIFLIILLSVLFALLVWIINIFKFEDYFNG